MGIKKGGREAAFFIPREQKTERAGPKGQTFHGHSEQNARKRATGKPLYVRA